MDVAVAGPPRAINLGSERPFRVGGAAVDPVSREAYFGSSCERLQPQNLKVLIALAHKRNKVVTREELVEVCWDGRFVGDDVINRSISTLRQFAERVGDFKIETVPRAGYRLIEASARPKHNGGRWIVVIILIVTILATFMSIDRTRRDKLTLTVGILPFAYENSDGEARRVASDVRTSLEHMLSDSGLAVKLVPVAPPSDRSAFDLLISGDVGRNERAVFAKVRIEESAHRATVFLHRFETPMAQVANLPDQIGANIAGTLSWTARLIILDRRHPSDPSITSEMFKLIDLDNVSALRSYDFARRLASRAPNSLIAQLQLAFMTAFALGDLPADQRANAVNAALRAAHRARLLAPEFGDVYVPWCLLHSPVRNMECEDRLRAGMVADPHAPFVGYFLSGLLQTVGRNGEALDQARLSLAQDQYARGKIGRLLRMLEVTGNSQEARKLYQQGARWFPDFETLFWERLSGIIERGDFSAIEALEKEVERAVWPGSYESVPALVTAVKMNSLAQAQEACSRAQASESFKSIQCMLALARLGDLDGAFTFADAIYPSQVGRTPAEEQALWLSRPWTTPPSFITSPAAEPLRRDPRFMALARRVGLLAYWRSGRPPDFCGKQAEPICAKLAIGR